MSVLSFHGNKLLPLAADSLADAPTAVRDAPQNFSCFNPALLPQRDHQSRAASLLLFRVSNMHFCGMRTSWRDSMRLQTHIRSYIAYTELDTDSPGSTELRSIPRFLPESATLFRAHGDTCKQWVDAGEGVLGTFSGPEDPRPFWSPKPHHAPWLLTSAWTDDCQRLRMHLIKLPSQHALWADSASDISPQTIQLPLVVTSWPEAAPMAHPEAEPHQKNWLPFVTRAGELMVQYSIEPHVVLSIDVATGRCVPLSTGGAIIGGGGESFASFQPLASLARKYGRISGGAAPLHLPSYSLYLGLAHLKEERQTPHHLGTARMVYRHIFYAFRDVFPFEMVAAGPPFVFPESLALESSTSQETSIRTGRDDSRRDVGSSSSTDGIGSTVQFAAGMALSSDETELIISYSTLDCGARLTRVSLDAVLSDIAVAW